MLFFVGCASKPLYNWEDNHLSNLYYTLQDEPSNKVSNKISTIQSFVLKCENERRKIAPTTYAYLGFLYLKVGDTANAFRNFKKEKKLFPQSSHFLNFLMKKGVKK